MKSWDLNLDTYPIINIPKSYWQLCDVYPFISYPELKGKLSTEDTKRRNDALMLFEGFKIAEGNSGFSLRDILPDQNHRRGNEIAKDFFYEQICNYSFSNKLKGQALKNVIVDDLTASIAIEVVKDGVRFFIDIEIDEPYNIVTRQPAHYVELNKNKLENESDLWEIVDAERDEQMVQKKWFVLRFSEQQVINYPQQCCRFISAMINIIFTFDKQRLFWLETESIYVKEEGRWSKEEASQYALSNFRESYLKNLSQGS